MSEAVREIELSMELTKAKIEKLETLNRLKENPDFKSLFLDDFLGEKRMGDLLTKKVSPSFQDPANKLYVDTQVQAIGAVKLFMLYTEQEANLAKQALSDAEDERNRAMEEVGA